MLKVVMVLLESYFFHGVVQGCLFSPILFNFFLVKISKVLSKTGFDFLAI